MSFNRRFTSLLAASVLSVCSLNALSVLFIGDFITDGMWGRSDDTYWIWDGIHPTAAGHKRMAELWEQSVNNRGLLY